MVLDICDAIALLLIASGHSVSVAESSLGRLITANLSSAAGASGCFLGSSVIYTSESGHASLDLDVIKLTGLKPLTESVVAETAHAAKLKVDATCGIA